MKADLNLPAAVRVPIALQEHRAYYNENDPKAAAWLRELMRAGLITKGEVDERSIQDVRGADLAGFTRCHFFAGIGGWDYALQLAGWPTGEPVWTGSCPCQPFSQAGKGAGESDSRHLWPHLRRLIEECRPSTIFGEQVASKAGRRWLDGVRTDLEALDHEVGAADLCSPGVRAPHIRQRLYWVAQRAWSGETPGISGQRYNFRSWDLRRMADSARDGCRQEREDGTGRVERSNAEGRSAGLGVCGATVRLGDSHDPRSQGRRIDAGEYASECVTGAAGAIGRMEHAGRERDEHRRVSGVMAGAGCDPESEAHQRERRGHADSDSSPTGRVAVSDGRESSDGELQRSAEHGQQPVNGRVGFWDAFDIVHCTDNKARRIEPGTFPLVAGLPKGVVRSSDSGAPINALASPEARMMRLRGYGNAIVPELAAEFIRAYMGVR